MKTKMIVVLGVLGLALGGIISGTVGCTGTSQSDTISHYTCPMHPHIHADAPGECPICHMTLVPVYKDGAGPQSAAPPGAVRIASDRQQLIGVKTVSVQRQRVTTTIRTVGRVAFDPALAVAQQEFVDIVRNMPSLKTAAATRLRLLGMSDEEIRALARTRKTSSQLYLPETGGAVWVYATLYQDELSLVQPGMSATITQANASVDRTMKGTVRAIDPVLDPVTRSARARIEVPYAGGTLRPESYVDVSIAIDFGEQLAIPASALIDTGTRQFAFVVTEGKYFQPRTVTTGSAGDDLVIIRDGLHEGDTIAATATFLIDSETQLKAALAADTAPSCPQGQAWDLGMTMCMPAVGK